jgi:hypothetical protein
MDRVVAQLLAEIDGAQVTLLDCTPPAACKQPCLMP